ncbi:MAG TPA: anti-sigma factor, partial [Paraburkholderia sp.]
MKHDDLGQEHEGSPPPDEDLSMLGAFVDDELPPGDRDALQARLDSDPQAAARVAAYRAQKAALQALCEGARVAGERAAPDVATALDAGPAVFVLRRREPWWWRAGMAAAWVAVGAGFAVAVTALVPRLASGPMTEQVAGAATPAGRGETPEAFARRADVAYAVYSPEQRHPVEVSAADEAHLVAWLSKRL